MDWLNGLFTLLGVTLGAGIAQGVNLLIHKQRFQTMIFEKRLQAHQEALTRIYELHEIMESMHSSDDDKNKSIKKVKNWWVDNQLFLDEASRNQMLVLIDAAYDHIYDSTVRRSVFGATWRETRKVIIRGIGVKYLPDTSKYLKHDAPKQN